MSQVMELWLSSYLVLLLIDSKTSKQDSNSSMTWPIYMCTTREMAAILAAHIFDNRPKWVN